VTSTIPTGFGFLVESTSTLHTYTFHRLVPKATEVTTVAGKATEIGRLGTAAAVEDMSILGTTDVVADLAILGTTDVVSDMNALAVTDVINDMNTLAVTDVISDMDVVATNVTNVNNVGNNITNVNSVSNSAGANQTFTVTVQNVSGNKYFIDGVQTPVLKLARGKTYTFDMSDSSNSSHPLAFRDSSDNSYTTGVTTSGTAGSSGATVVIVVAANAPSSLKYYCTSHGNSMGNTITVIDDNVGIVAGSISNVNIVGGAITNVNNVGNSISNVNNVASNLGTVNDFAARYRSGANNPTTSLDTGDLFFNTTSNSLKVYTGSAWVDGVTATGNFAVVTGNTFTGSNNHNDNVKSIYGTGSDLEIYHSSGDSHITNSDGNLNIVNSTDGWIRLQPKSGEEGVIVKPDGAVELYYDNSKKLETISSGVSVTGSLGVDTSIPRNSLHVRGDATMRLTPATDGANAFESGRIRFTETANLLQGTYIHYDGNNNLLHLGTHESANNTVSDDFNALSISRAGGHAQFHADVTLTGSSYNAVWDKSDNALEFADNAKAIFGSGNDLQIYHDGSNSWIDNGTGLLRLSTDGAEIELTGTNGGEYLGRFINNGAVELYHDGSKKFETTSGGVNVTGSLTVNGSAINTDLVSDTSPQLGGQLESNGNNIKMADNDQIKLGSDSDVSFYHNGSSGFLNCTTGDLQLKTSGSGDDVIIRAADDVVIQPQNGEDGIKVIGNGGVELYHNNSQKFKTVSDGAMCTGHFQVTGGNNIYLNDTGELRCGDSGDLQIYHDGTNSYINDTGTGRLKLQSNQVQIRNAANTENMAQFTENGAVELYFNNSVKFETNTNGCLVGDNVKLQIGGSADLQLYHDGSHSRIVHTGGGTSELLIAGDIISLNNGSQSEYMFKGTSNGSAELYYDNSKKFFTVSDGAEVTGNLTVSGNIGGNGASITNVNATSLGGLSSGVFLRSNANDTCSGRIIFDYNSQNNNDDIATSTGSLGGFEVYNSGSGNDAFMSFHTGGDFACYFGLNADTNKLAVGGWSMGASKYDIAHEGSSYIPVSNNSFDLGSSSNRWRNVYTNDLNLSNKGSSNDVDQTWGDWTIQEGESDLFLKNNRSGKKYKFNLTEVS